MKYSKEQIEQMYSIKFDPSEAEYNDKKIDIHNGNYHVNDNDSGILLNAQGVYYMKIVKDYEEAKKYFTLAVEKGHKNASINLGSIYDEDGNHELAYKYYVKGANDNNLFALMGLGYMFTYMSDNVYNANYYNHYNISKYEVAEKYFNDAKKLGYDESYIGLASLYLTTKEYDKALANAKIAVEKNIVCSHYILARIYHYMGNANDAISTYEYIVSNKLARYDDALSILSLIYTKTEDYDMAEKYLKLLVLINNNDACLRLAKLYIETNRQDMAINILIKGVDLKSTECMIELYKIYINNNKYDLANEILKKIDEYGKGEKLFNLGSWIFEKQNDLRMAIKYWELCIERCSEKYSEYLKTHKLNIIARCMNNIGSAYATLNSRLEALDWHIKSIKNCIDDENDLIFIINNIKAHSYSTEFYYIITENNLNLPYNVTDDIINDLNVIQFKDMIQNNFIASCYICSEDDVKCVKMKCNNDICIKCLSTLFVTNKCPYCRGNIIDDKDQKIFNPYSFNKNIPDDNSF